MQPPPAPARWCSTPRPASGNIHYTCLVLPEECFTNITKVCRIMRILPAMLSISIQNVLRCWLNAFLSILNSATLQTSEASIYGSIYCRSSEVTSSHSHSAGHNDTSAAASSPKLSRWIFSASKIFPTSKIFPATRARRRSASSWGRRCGISTPASPQPSSCSPPAPRRATWT